jgi:hypothetical protein
MKIAPFPGAVALLASGCSPQAASPAAEAPAGTASPTTALCVAPVTREVAMTAADAKDVLTAEAIGAKCEQAVLVLTLRKSNGMLLWSRSVRATDTWAFVPASDDTPVDPKKGMETFLADVFTHARIEKSGKAPDWPEGAERPEDPSGFYHTTPMSRDACVILRQKNAPMVCVQAEMGTSYCVSYHPEFADVANTFYASSA